MANSCRVFVDDQAVGPVTTLSTPPHPLRVSLTRGHWWGAPTPLKERSGATPPVSSRLGSKLSLLLYADVRLHIPMTHNHDAGHVVIDHLGAISPKSDAWQELVLPAGVKEMLLATSAAALRSAVGSISVSNADRNGSSGCSSDGGAGLGGGGGSGDGGGGGGGDPKELSTSAAAAAAAAADSPCGSDPSHAVVQRLAMQPRYRTRDVIGNKGEGSLFLLYGQSVNPLQSHRHSVLS